MSSVQRNLFPPQELLLVGAAVKTGIFDALRDGPLSLDDLVSALGADSGIRLVPGDMTVGLPEGPFHLAYLGNVCHIFDGEENQKIFKRVFDVLRPGGRIAVQDFVRGVSPRSALFGVNMLVNTQKGGTWTLDQYREWLTGAGFAAVKMKDYAERQLITAERP